MDGILVINKPSGMTSHDVINQLRRILQEKKAGHTGTLDPDATGVLPVCLGKATKIIQFLEDKEKGYEGTIAFGVTTDTMDAKGQIIKISDSTQLKQDEVRQVFDSFIGEIFQTPPMVSAIKVNGKRLYEIARQGKTIDRTPRKIHIDDLQLIRFYEEAIPDIDPLRLFTKVDFRVLCSRGTYVRSLASDVGDSLGCGAHLSRLVRTRSGHFKIDDSIELEAIKNDPQIVVSALRSIDDALSFMPLITVSDYGKKRFINGVLLDVSDVMTNKDVDFDTLVRIHDKMENLLGIARIMQSNLNETVYKPIKVLSQEVDSKI
jgi:tRNA pseudouridine55 synthase